MRLTFPVAWHLICFYGGYALLGLSDRGVGFVTALLLEVVGRPMVCGEGCEHDVQTTGTY